MFNGIYKFGFRKVFEYLGENFRWKAIHCCVGAMSRWYYLILVHDELVDDDVSGEMIVI